ncbi:hypothetical protein ACLOJK_036691 [Asimina triloba]
MVITRSLWIRYYICYSLRPVLLRRVKLALIRILAPLPGIGVDIRQVTWLREGTFTNSAEVPEMDALNMLNANFDVLNRKLDEMNMNATGLGDSTFDWWGGDYQSTESQSFVQDFEDEQMTYFNQIPTGNLYPSDYDLEWTDQPDFYWSDQHEQNNNFLQAINSSDFQQWNYDQSIPNPTQSQISSLELMVENLIIAQKQQQDSFFLTLQQLTSKVDQLALHSEMLEKKIAQQDDFLGQPNLNSNEFCEAITLRNEIQVEDQQDNNGQVLEKVADKTDAPVENELINQSQEAEKEELKTYKLSSVILSEEKAHQVDPSTFPPTIRYVPLKPNSLHHVINVVTIKDIGVERINKVRLYGAVKGYIIDNLTALINFSTIEFDIITND